MKKLTVDSEKPIFLWHVSESIDEDKEWEILSDEENFPFSVVFPLPIGKILLLLLFKKNT
jgi:hypothetical protein